MRKEIEELTGGINRTGRAVSEEVIRETASPAPAADED
jgi:hypothetical protein